MKTLEEIRGMERDELEAFAITLEAIVLALDTGRALAEERATVAEGWYVELYNIIEQSDLLSRLPAYHREKAAEYYNYICEKKNKNQQP